jgi:phosphatidylglycerol:prolipoprotein diacylglycerol transferase
VIKIDWNPVPHAGPVPINWYGLTFALGFIVGGWLVWRWAAHLPALRAHLEPLMLWIAAGAVLGSRLYYVVQNDASQYFLHPWRILAVWQGGLAYFGGLFGALAAAVLYLRRQRMSFWQVADVFAPAIAIGSAIGRISCGLDGMDYGTPTRLPWGFVYTNPNSYAPVDGIARHPDQFYELLADLLIAWLLLKLRGKVPDGVLFLSYLLMFGTMRFLVFFVRGNVPVVAFGLKNAQWTALAILAAALPLLLWKWKAGRRRPAPASCGAPAAAER